MKKVSRTALLPYSALQMYNLVNDVAAYPEFLPWCGAAEVVSEVDREMVAKVTIAKAGLSQTFETKNYLTPGEKIEMHLLEGPFKHLEGEWLFKPLDENACKIQFEVAFEVNNGVLNIAIGTMFEHISSTLVDSFCERAKVIYG